MRCAACDELLPSNAAFCSNCGRSVKTSFDSTLPATGTTIYTQYDETQAPAPPPTYVYPTIPPPTSSAAVVSLVFGLLAWFFLPVIAAIVAVIAGHMARREMRESSGQVGGHGLAMAGLILGYVQLVLVAAGSCLVLLFLTLVLAA